MERRACQHQSVDQCDGDARGCAAGQGAEHAAGGRTVDVQSVADARVEGGDYVWLVLVDEAEVADEGLVEDGIDGGAIVGGAVRQAAHAHAWAGPLCFSVEEQTLLSSLRSFRHTVIVQTSD